MLYTLENEMAVLKVDTYACEIHSFRKKDKDIEYMWNGDPAYWSGRNPVLFPHVSSPKDKNLNFKGKDFKVNNHGFCRRSEFEFVEQGDDYLLFRLADDETTYEQYPYRFELLVRYTLKQNRVFIDYQITNRDEEKMYFGFGQHPAFNCPLVPGKSFSDYRIEFEKEDVEGGRLDLSYELFERYPTYIVNNPESRTFTLTDGENKVVMRVSDQYRIFALWTPHAPFICLEPWVNTLDDTEDVPFEERPGNVCLLPEEEYRISYSFEII